MKQKLNKIETAFIKFANMVLVPEDKIAVKTGNMDLSAIATQEGNLLVIKCYSRSKQISFWMYDNETAKVIVDKKGVQ